MFYVDAIKAIILCTLVFVDTIVRHLLVDHTKPNFSNPQTLQEATIRESVRHVAVLSER